MNRRIKRSTYGFIGEKPKRSNKREIQWNEISNFLKYSTIGFGAAITLCFNNLATTATHYYLFKAYVAGILFCVCGFGASVIGATIKATDTKATKIITWVGVITMLVGATLFLILTLENISLHSKTIEKKLPAISFHHAASPDRTPT
ncbi:hypothetical protein WH96_07105 [Kiloniella spongiae]|uniref:Uncharacterized protein n=1 Tax=Kiloniella spongiae TaxID=1489064 RepID=A0A0H2MGD5_9PROT|nr:hypothetical protein [Kiloniella spongiae]KLN61398.1 hypothetical protein WH96_07105 [Kiloniella spongiae]